MRKRRTPCRKLLEVAVIVLQDYRHLHLDHFLHSQTSLEDAQSDSRNFAGGKMDPQEIVYYPVHS